MAVTPQGRPDDRVLREMMERMLEIRIFEQRLSRMCRRGEVPGWVHLYIGQEASAVGVCSTLTEQDRITSTHRGHGHLIAKGADMRRMMAEILGKAEGMCRGKGGSMHIVDFSLGIMGTNGIVGGGMSIATGAAWADSHLGTDKVTVCFFGDGAANQGVFLESMNLAAVWKLPVIFVCENNSYAEWTRVEDSTAGTIAERGVPLGIPGERVDGNDVLAVYETVGRAVARARTGGGPSLVETLTYRWHGHNEGEEVFSGQYRPDEEQQQWRAKDPVEQFRARLRAWNVMEDQEFTELSDDVSARVENAVEYAKAGSELDPEEAFTDLFAQAEPMGEN